MNTFNQITDEILAILGREEAFLRALPEDVITTRFNHQNRSIKMLLGHLIDSASNNHQRMVRLQDYQHEDWDTLLSLWKYCNLHIIQVIKSADPTKMDNYWLDYEGNQVTLRDMIIGYTSHLDLHIGHIHKLVENP